MSETLLIGQGLAGSILSLALHERGQLHHIIDDPFLSASSRVAAGIVNPIVLKRLKPVQDADLFLPAAVQFYNRWGYLLKEEFYNRINIHHIFSSPGQVNDWLVKSELPKLSPYLGKVIPNTATTILAPHGLGVVEHTAWLQTDNFLKAHLSHHQSTMSYSEEEVLPQKLTDLAKEFRYVIICNGHLMRKLTPQTAEAFAPTRGEVMIVESEDLPQDVIYHGPVFILPLGHNRFKVGATYHWDLLQDTTTAGGLGQLKSEFEKIFNGGYKVVQHLAGVRPNIKDRKPLVGRITKNIYAFNGLGSRGVLMAPYLADIFLDHLLEHKKLPDRYNVERFLQGGISQ